MASLPTAHCQIALMSPGIAEGHDPVATVYASLGAGDTILPENRAQGLMGRALVTANIRTTLIGDANSDDTGPYRPARLFLPAPNSVSEAGTVPDATAPGGKRTDPKQLWQATEAALITCDLVIVHDGDFSRCERENQAELLLPVAYAQHRRRALAALAGYWRLVQSRADLAIMLVVPTPPLLPNGQWDRLTPFCLTGTGGLTSATTQTPGLIASRDIAPTILSLLHVPIPLQMTGVAVTFSRVSLAGLARLDTLTRLNQLAQYPVFWTLGLAGALVLAVGLALFLTKRLARNKAIRRSLLYGLRLLSAWPLAMLLAPLCAPPSLIVYVGEIAVLTTLTALLPSPSIIFALTALVIVGDGLTGTTLVSQSVLSGYALAGIRFYGIGNEYMGLLLGGALLAGAAWWNPPAPDNGGAKRERLSFPTPPLPGAGGAFLWFALVTFVLSFPAFGAKAGGAVTATATFALAWLRLRQIPFRFRYLILSIAAGFALVFVWAALGHVLHLRRTHLETAVDALENGRLGYIAGVTLRKVGMAGRILVHPATLLGLLGLALAAGAGRVWLWPGIHAILQKRTRLAAVTEAGLWGALVCVLFNDSGIVAAILLVSTLGLTLLHDLFGEIPPPPAPPPLRERGESDSDSLSLSEGGGLGWGLWRNRLRMRFVALDVGNVRIGIAVCDPLETAAFPVGVVKRPGTLKRDVEAVAAVLLEQEAEAVVVGLPLSLDGDIGPQARLVQGFGRALAASTGLPLVYWDESLSSVEANERMIAHGVSRIRRRETIDQQAAAIILESYLTHRRATQADRHVVSVGWESPP